MAVGPAVGLVVVGLKVVGRPVGLSVSGFVGRSVVGFAVGLLVGLTVGGSVSSILAVHPVKPWQP